MGFKRKSSIELSVFQRHRESRKERAILGKLGLSPPEEAESGCKRTKKDPCRKFQRFLEAIGRDWRSLAGPRSWWTLGSTPPLESRWKSEEPFRSFAGPCVLSCQQPFKSKSTPTTSTFSLFTLHEIPLHQQYPNNPNEASSISFSNENLIAATFYTGKHHNRSSRTRLF